MDKQVDARMEHPTAAPVSHRARWTALGAVVAVVLGAGGLMTATAVGNSGTKSVFVAITPCRVMDTRPAPQTVGPRSTPIGVAETHTIAITGSNGNCTVPGEATGVSLNVTATNPSADSFITVFPADAPRPVASSLNFVGAQPPVPNAVTVNLSADGKISFYNHSGSVDVIADIVGYYLDESHNHDDRYYTKGEIDTGYYTKTDVNAGYYTKTDVNAHEATQKYIPIDLFGLETRANVVLTGSLAGLSFDDASTDNAVTLNFVAPPDLTPDTHPTLRVNFVISQTNCTVSLGARQIWVFREGETSPTVPRSTKPIQPGIVPVGGDPLPAPTPSGSNGIALYTLGQPDDGGGLRPGDAVSVSLGRNVSDTCADNLIVTGIELLYT